MTNETAKDGETIMIQALNANREVIDVEVPCDPQHIEILDMPALGTMLTDLEGAILE